MSESTSTLLTVDRVLAELTAALTGETGALRFLLENTPADLVAAAIAEFSPSEQRALVAAFGNERFARSVRLLD